jgi:hypothetical protein
VALVSRHNGNLQQYPVEVHPVVQPTYQETLSVSTEIVLADLEIRPSSSGSGALQAYLDFEAGNSGREKPFSGTALLLSAKIDPKELPLLSGLIGRSFMASWKQPQGLKDLEALRKELAELRDRYQYIQWTLKELVSEMPL